VGETRTAALPKTPDSDFVARVRMRDAKPDDIAALVPLINDAYKARDGWLFGTQMRVTADDLRDELEDPRTIGIVATVDGAIAGFAVVRRREGEAEFGLLATERAHQGRGLARLIMQRAESITRDAGLPVIRLQCIRENGLPPFYEAFGYTIEREEYGERWNSLQPFTLVTMSKQIPAFVARPADPAFAARVRFRFAEHVEAGALAGIINEAYLREAWLLPPPRTTESELRRDLERPAYRLIVAEVEGEPAGTVAVSLAEHDDHGPEFGMLAVAPRFQGAGLAALLVAEAERLAREGGFTTMTLECAKELGLPPFYESLGYSTVREDIGYYLGSDRPIARVTMRKDLTG